MCAALLIRYTKALPGTYSALLNIKAVKKKTLLYSVLCVWRDVCAHPLMKLGDEPQLCLQVSSVLLSRNVTQEILMPHPRCDENVPFVLPRLLILSKPQSWVNISSFGSSNRRREFSVNSCKRLFTHLNREDLHSDIFAH